MHCTVEEAQERMTPQAFRDKLTYWETHPPLYDHINICLAQVSATIANSNRGKGQRAYKMDKFLIDYTASEPVEDKIKRIFGGMRNGRH